MALPFDVFAALDCCDTVQLAGFAVPYTLLMQRGSVGAAYSTSAEHGLRKEYDVGERSIQHGLGIDDELNDFMGASDPIEMNRIAASFRELLTVGAALSTKCLNCEHLTPQQTHNVWRRGFADSRPFNLVDVSEGFDMLKVSEPKRPVPKLPPPTRSGILQVAIPPADGSKRFGSFRVAWERTGPGIVDERYFDPESRTQKWTIEHRKNIHPARSTKRYAFERGTTFEGPRTITEAAEVDDGIADRLCRAAEFILVRYEKVHKKPLERAVLHFQMGPSDVLYFLFAAFLRVAGVASLEQPPAFVFPKQYDSYGKNKPRPTSDHTNQEDLIRDPMSEQLVGSPTDKRGGRRSNSPNKNNWVLDDLRIMNDASSSDEGDDSRLLSPQERYQQEIERAERKKARERKRAKAERRHQMMRPMGDVTASPAAESSQQGAEQQHPGVGKKIDYDRLLEAIETTFPAPLPEHARKHMLKAKQMTPTKLKKLVSPTPDAPREHPAVNFEAQANREYSNIVGNTKSLLAVLEGKRPLDEKLATRCELTDGQKRFLRGGLIRETAGKTIGGSAKVTYAEERGLPEWADPNKASKKQPPTRSSTPSGLQSSVALSRAKPPTPLESRTGFYVSMTIDRAAEDRAVLRGGSHHPPMGRVAPLKRKTKTTVPPGGFKSAARAKALRDQIAREKAERQRRRREDPSYWDDTKDFYDVKDSYETGSHDYDGSDSDDMFGSGGGSHPLSPQMSVASNDFPELADFSLVKSAVALPDALDEERDILRRARDGLGLSITSLSGSATSFANRQQSALMTRLYDLDEALQELHKSRRAPTVKERVEYLLEQPLPGKISEVKETSMQAMHLQLSVRRATEYLEGLAYHLNNFKLTHVRGAKKKDKKGNRQNSAGSPPGTSRRRSSSPTGGVIAAAANRGPALLFSMQPADYGVILKRLVAFLQTIPSFEQMNTEDNINELQYLLVGTQRNAKHRQSISAGSGENAATIAPDAPGMREQAIALDDATYAVHTAKEANIVSIPTFAVKDHVANYELVSKFDRWILEQLRVIYIERLEEIEEEAESILEKHRNEEEGQALSGESSGL